MRPVFRTLDRFCRSNMLVMSTSVLLLVLGQAFIDVLIHIFGAKTSSNVIWLTAAILISLAITIGTLSKIYKDIDIMTERIGLTTAYYPLDAEQDTPKRDQQADELYGACGHVVNSVSEKPGSWIKAVNSFTEINHQDKNGHVEAACRRYLATLRSKIGHIPYSRIIQLVERDLTDLQRRKGSIGNLLPETYREHYLEMARATTSSHGRFAAKVEAVRAKYPISFVLVHDADDADFGGRLIWQMHEHVYNERADSVQLTGVLIVTDPKGTMLRPFFDYFEELDRSSARHRLTLSNLELKERDMEE